MTKSSRAAAFIIMVVVLATMLFPLLYMIWLSFKSETGDAINAVENYKTILARGQLWLFLLNSAIVAIAVTIGNLFFCLMTGYALARGKFAGSGALYLSAAATLMIPSHILIIPIYMLVSKIGLFDTYWALILPFLVSPLGVFLMTQYIRGLPDDCEQAARIDGAGEFTILFRIVAPLCRPALAVLAIQTFMTNWNSFVFPFILTSRPELYTLPVGIAMIQGMQGLETPQLMAGCTITTLPVIAVFLFFQRHIIEGITAGAVKG